MRHNRSRFNFALRGISVLGGIGLFLLSVAACSRATWSQWINPVDLQLLALIELPNEVITDQVVVTANGYAYVLNWSGSIAIVDGPNLATLLPLPADRARQSWEGQIAVHPQTDLVYLTDAYNGQVYVLKDTEIVDTITDIGSNPSLLAIHPRTGYVYVSSKRAAPDLGSIISVITATHVITTIPIGLHSMVITPDEISNKVYIGQYTLTASPLPRAQQASLAVIDETTLITMTSLDYPGEDSSINEIAINPNTGEIYMLENLSALVYWHGDVVKRLYLGQMGYTALNDIAIDRRSNLVYVSSWGESQSHVVVLDHDQVVAAIVVGNDPRQIVIDETHDAIYVVNRLSGTISVIRDTTVIATVRTKGNGPMHMGLDADRGYLYVANSDSHDISVFGINH